MVKKLILISFLLLNFFSITYPSQKENTKLFDYCNSLEMSLSRNSLKRRDNLSKGVKSITNDVLNFGLTKSKGSLLIMQLINIKNRRIF